MNSKKQRVALVTGASSGIGMETAKQLTNEGLVVYAAARRVDRMKELEQMGVIALRMDVTSDADMVNGVQQIGDVHGGVDILVNNAGYAVFGAVEDTPLEEARRQFEVNLFGLARLTQLVLPHMREQRAGKIINVSSLGGKIYTPLGAWYYATKHALEAWSDCLRIEVAQFGIDVVIIEPGLIQTEIGESTTGGLMERSGNTPYSKMAKRVERSSLHAHKHASHPSLIASVIAKAVRSNRPRTRYAAGRLARPLLLMRRWLPDRMFDRLVTN